MDDWRGNKNIMYEPKFQVLRVTFSNHAGYQSLYMQHCRRWRTAAAAVIIIVLQQLHTKNGTKQYQQSRAGNYYALQMLWTHIV